MMCRCLDDTGRAVELWIDFIDNLNWLFPNANILLQSALVNVAPFSPSGLNLLFLLHAN